MQMHEHRHSISIKMAAPLETCTEQHFVIRFLRSEGVKPIEIHRRMKVEYGDACLSQQQVYEWSRKFANGVIQWKMLLVQVRRRFGALHA